MSGWVMIPVVYCAIGVAISGRVMDELYDESPDEFRRDWLVCYLLLILLAVVWGVLFLKFWMDDHGGK